MNFPIAFCAGKFRKFVIELGPSRNGIRAKKEHQFQEMF